jgi:hypothetical protein
MSYEQKETELIVGHLGAELSMLQSAARCRTTIKLLRRAPADA